MIKVTRPDGSYMYVTPTHISEMKPALSNMYSGNPKSVIVIDGRPQAVMESLDQIASLINALHQ